MNFCGLQHILTTNLMRLFHEYHNYLISVYSSSHIKFQGEKTPLSNINLENVQMVINLGKVLEGNDFATFWKLVNEEYQVNWI